VLRLADEVVNIDLTAHELITRLREGKIYDAAKVETALKNFFRSEKILQLRELALKEVASQVERKIDLEVPKNIALRHERFLACINSNHEVAKMIIRKTARLASYYNSDWYVLYVQTKNESPDSINLTAQRHLINNFKLATELGAEVISVTGDHVARSIVEVAGQKEITTICMGKPHFKWIKMLLRQGIFNQLTNRLSESDIDLVILS
jgi:two-component system sensor histidine kinase KdpD